VQVPVQEPGPVPVQEPGPERVAEQEQPEELMAVAKSNLAPRSFDSRYHRNP
jgi:hypothetical protein